MTIAVVVSLSILIAILIAIDATQRAKPVRRKLGARVPTDHAEIPPELVVAFAIVTNAMFADSGIDRSKMRLDDQLRTLGYGYDWADDESLDLCAEVHAQIKIDKPTKAFKTVREIVEYTHRFKPRPPRQRKPLSPRLPKSKRDPVTADSLRSDALPFSTPTRPESIRLIKGTRDV